MIHELKTWPKYFEEILTGNKTFEVRKNDRDFKQDDTLLLKEWNPEYLKYTGREISKKVGYVLKGRQFGIEAEHCVMSIK